MDNQDIVSIIDDDGGDNDSDVEIIETLDQIIVLDEDSCEAADDDHVINKAIKKSAKTPAFGEAYIPLDTKTIKNNSIQSISQYQSTLTALKPNVNVGGLQILTPYTINKKHTDDHQSPLLSLFYEDKRPWIRTTPVPLYKSVFSSESAMLKKKEGPCASNNKNNEKTATASPPKKKRRKRSTIINGNSANDSVIFVSETFLPDTAVVLPSLRRNASKLKNKNTAQVYL